MLIRSVIEKLGDLVAIVLQVLSNPAWSGLASICTILALVYTHLTYKATIKDSQSPSTPNSHQKNHRTYKLRSSALKIYRNVKGMPDAWLRNLNPNLKKSFFFG